MNKFVTIGVILTIFSFSCLNTKCSSSQSLGSSGNVSLDITKVVNNITEGNSNLNYTPSLSSLLQYGNQYGYYESDNLISNLWDLINSISNIGERIPQDAKILISFRDFRGFELSKDQQFTIYPLPPESVVGIILNLDINALCRTTSADERTNYSVSIQQIKNSFPSLQIGIGISAENITGCENLLSQIRTANLLLVKVLLKAHLKCPESYRLFSDMMNTHDSNIRNFVANINPPPNIMFHLKLETQSDAISEGDQEYILLVEEFGSKWAESRGSNVILELPDYSRLPRLGGSPKDHALRNLHAIPSLHRGFTQDNLTMRSYPYALNKISSEFHSLHLKHTLVDLVARNWNISKQHSNDSTILSTPLDIVLELNEESITSFHQLVSLAPPLIQSMTQLEPYNVHLKVVEFVAVNWDPNKYDRYSQDITMPEIKQLMGNVGVGCLIAIHEQNGYTPEHFVSETRHHCGALFDAATHFTWYASQVIKGFNVDSYPVLQQTLSKFVSGRAELRKIKPNATVVLRLYRQGRSWEPFDSSTTRVSRDFYCNDNFLRMNRYMEAVHNWGRIHNFPITWKEAFQTNVDIGWWSQVQPGNEISDEITFVPKFVMRNHPDNMLNMKTDSCVILSSERPSEMIQFDKDYSGATLDVGARSQPWRVEEMQTILLFILQKLKSVEILFDKEPKSAALQLQILQMALSPSFMELMESNGLSQGTINLQIPMPNDEGEAATMKSEIAELATAMELSKSYVRLDGIHVSNWEKSSKVLHFLTSLTHDVKVGLVVRNCSALLNSLPHVETPDTLSKVDYILCETGPASAENDQLQFARNMDSQLYLSSAFARFNLDFEVYFRLNSYPCCGYRKTSNMLGFLSGVNQFASGNKIKYFLVQVFSQTSNISSWWRVTNYGDLANLSVYVDKEAEYLRNPTWKPNLEMKSSSADGITGSESSWNWLFGVFGVLLLILLSIGAVFYIRYRQRTTPRSNYEMGDYLVESAETSFQ